MASRTNEANDLRLHNRTLMEENKRLSDLARLLLSSPQFTPILEQLSSQGFATPAHSQAQSQGAENSGNHAQNLTQPRSQPPLEHSQSDSRQSIDSSNSVSTDSVAAVPPLPSQTSPVRAAPSPSAA